MESDPIGIWSLTPLNHSMESDPIEPNEPTTRRDAILQCHFTDVIERLLVPRVREGRMSVTDMWWLSLAIFAAVVLVVAVLLGLIIAAAKSIDRHAGAIWVVGKDIAGNTVSIWMLEQTVGALRRLAESVRRLEQALGGLDARLGGTAGAAER